MSTVTSTADVDTPVLRETVYALGGGTFLFALAVGALAWVWGALPFVGPGSSSGLWPAFGVLVMTLLALLFFVYGWALVARGLTEIIARGVAAGMARENR